MTAVSCAGAPAPRAAGSRCPGPGAAAASSGRRARRRRPRDTRRRTGRRAGPHPSSGNARSLRPAASGSCGRRAGRPPRGRPPRPWAVRTSAARVLGQFLDLGRQERAARVDGEQPDPCGAGRQDLEAAVGTLTDLRRVGDAADPVEGLQRIGPKPSAGACSEEARRRPCPACRWPSGRLAAVADRDHDEAARSVLVDLQQVAHHGAITLLEDVERQHEAGEQHRVQREERQASGGHNGQAVMAAGPAVFRPARTGAWRRPTRSRPSCAVRGTRRARSSVTRGPRERGRVRPDQPELLQRLGPAAACDQHVRQQVADLRRPGITVGVSGRETGWRGRRRRRSGPSARRSPGVSPSVPQQGEGRPYGEGLHQGVPARRPRPPARRSRSTRGASRTTAAERYRRAATWQP